MKNKGICELYGRIMEDENIRNSLKIKAEKVKNDQDLKEFIKNEILPIAKKMQLNCTEEDILNYEKETMEKLSLDGLGDVSGGISAKSLLMSGGIVSLVLLGAGFNSGTQSHAEVARTDIVSSTNELQKRLQSGTSAALTAGTPGDGSDAVEENTAQTETSSTDFSVYDSIELEEESTAQTETSSNQYTDFSYDSTELEEENTDQTETPPTLTRQDTDSSADAKTELEKGKELAGAALRRMPEANYSDPEYVVEGLNLIDPFIMKETGEVEGLRFMDGNTEKIQLNKENESRIYNYDEGKGSSSYMRMLFPSVSGTLNLTVTAQRSTSFANNCQPTPEVYAGIINYWHNAVRVNGVKPLEFTADDLGDTNLQNLSSDRDKSSLNKTDILKKLQKVSEKVEKLNKEIKEKKNSANNNADELANINQKIDDLKKEIKKTTNQQTKATLVTTLKETLIKQRELKKSNTETQEKNLKSLQNNQKTLTLKLMMSYLPTEHFTKLAEENESTPENDNFKITKYAGLKTVLNLLNEGATMILNQEVNDGEKADKTRVLPKYTTEKMLLAHFLMYKNTKEEINEFYNCVSSGLEGKTVKDTEAPLGEALSTLTKRTKFVKKLKRAKNSPYQAQTKEHGNTYRVSFDDNNKITFNNSMFADCADTAVRHVVNLLCYNAEQKWTKLIKENEEENYRKDLNNVLEAIKTGGTVDNKSLKDKLKMFYLHQKDVGADEGNRETRSLWNYAICGMNRPVEDGLYTINYCRNGFELEIGYENNIKLIYNIAKALDLADENALAEAKRQIDNLSDNFKAEDALNAVQTVYRLLSDDVEVSGNLKQEDQLWVGGLEVTSEKTNSFSISQINNHGWVDFNPIELYSEEFIDDNMKFIKKDEWLKLLAMCYSENKEFKPQDLSTFHRLYCCQVDGYRSEDMSHLDANYKNNYSALRFLKEIQEDDDNVKRMLYLIRTYGLDLDKVTLKYTLKESSETKDLKNFIKTKYGSQICSYLFKSYGFSDEEKSNLLRQYKLDNHLYTADDGAVYYCSIEHENEKETVVLYASDPEDWRKDYNRNITIPAEVTLNGKTYRVSGIGKNAFKNVKLQSITMPKTIDGNFTIGEYAFANCLGLTSITMPQTIIGNFNINGSAFYNCTSLNSIDMQETVVKGNFTIGEHAFDNCKELASIKMPEKITGDLNLDNFAFSGSLGLISITMPEEITNNFTIGEYAFDNCKKLNSITMPQTIGHSFTIGEYAFDNCKKLNSIKMPQTVTDNFTIGKSAFNGCSDLNSITMPDEITNFTIGEYAFDNCKKLNSIKMPDKIKGNFTIQMSAFNGCSDLNSIIMPEEITNNFTIDNGAFTNCSGLNSITMPQTIGRDFTIGNFAFSCCSDLNSITMPDEITGNFTIGYGAFIRCSSLDSIKMPKKVKGNFTIENEVFEPHSASLKSIDMQETVVEGNFTIKEHAFWCCKKLDSITMPQTVTGNFTIKEHAFENCSELDSIEMPQTVNGDFTIKEHAFEYCSELESITMPQTVTGNFTIKEHAFENCTGLKSINMQETVINGEPIIENDAFKNCPKFDPSTLLKTVKDDLEIK